MVAFFYIYFVKTLTSTLIITNSISFAYFGFENKIENIKYPNV